MGNKKEPFEVIRARHYANVFSGESGEFVLQDLLKESGMYNDGFDPDPTLLAHAAGKRTILCYILQSLQLNEMEVYAKTKLDSVLNNEFAKSSDFDKSYESGFDQEYSNATFNNEGDSEQ